MFVGATPEQRDATDALLSGRAATFETSGCIGFFHWVLGDRDWMFNIFVTLHIRLL
jgi:hypothetical protein